MLKLDRNSIYLRIKNKYYVDISDHDPLGCGFERLCIYKRLFLFWRILIYDLGKFRYLYSIAEEKEREKEEERLNEAKKTVDRYCSILNRIFS